MHCQRAVTHLLDIIGQVQFEIDAKLRAALYEKSIAHDGLDAQDAQESVHQSGAVIFEAEQAPRIGRTDGRHGVLNQAFETSGHLLEMVRHEQHAFMPLNGVGDSMHDSSVDLSSVYFLNLGGLGSFGSASFSTVMSSRSSATRSGFDVSIAARCGPGVE